MTKKAQVMRYMENHPEAKPKEISRETGVNINTVRCYTYHAHADEYYRLQGYYKEPIPSIDNVELTINLSEEYLKYRHGDEFDWQSKLGNKRHLL